MTEWYCCAECGPRARIEFWLPDTVYCDGCGQQIGETVEKVENELAAINPLEGTIVDAETGEELTTVEWDSERTRCGPR